MALSRATQELIRALIGAAQEQRCVPRVVADVMLVQSSLEEESGAMSSFLFGKAIPLAERQRAVREAWRDVIHPFVLHAFLMFLETNTTHDIRAFTHQVVVHAQSLADHYEVTVKSAVPLTNEERQRLDIALQNRFGGTHRVHEYTEPALLGGLRLEFGHTLIDASVRGRLERLRQTLSHSFSS